jgi:hypothetical protein
MILDMDSDERFITWPAVLVKSIARLIDVGGVLSVLPTESEDEAMQTDWRRVGVDLRAAMSTVVEDVPPDTRDELLDEELVKG